MLEAAEKSIKRMLSWCDASDGVDEPRDVPHWRLLSEDPAGIDDQIFAIAFACHINLREAPRHG